MDASFHSYKKLACVGPLLGIIRQSERLIRNHYAGREAQLADLKNGILPGVGYVSRIINEQRQIAFLSDGDNVLLASGCHPLPDIGSWWRYPSSLPRNVWVKSGLIHSGEFLRSKDVHIPIACCRFPE